MIGIEIREVQWTTSARAEGRAHRYGPNTSDAPPPVSRDTEAMAGDRDLKQHIAIALTTAVDILSHTCVGWVGLRIAPIELISDASAGGVIMSTRTFIALTEWNGTLAWVPTALVRQHIPLSEMSDFERQVPYDMTISVNRDCKFALSDPSCAFVHAQGDGSTYFSSVTVLVHELLHGMGLFSLGKDPGLLGNATHPNQFGTPWDNLLRDSQGSRFVPVARALAGQQIDGVEVNLDGIAIYNPNPWQPGSSLSHFARTSGRPAIMAPSIDTGTCAFTLPPHITSTMNLLGWSCNVNGTPPSLYWDHGAVYSNPTDCRDCNPQDGVLPLVQYTVYFIPAAVLFLLLFVCVRSNSPHTYTTLQSK